MEQEKRVAATKESQLSSTILFQKNEEMAMTEALNEEKVVLRDADRVSQTKEEAAISQYETYVDELSESRTFALMNQLQSAANLRAVEESIIESTMNIEQSTAAQLAQQNVALKSKEAQERKFQIEMTKSERTFEKEDDQQISESINTASLKELATGQFREFGDEQTQICTLFGKIVQKKFESDGCDYWHPIARRWQEQVTAKAAGSEKMEVISTLERTAPAELVQKTIQATNDSKTMSQLKATTSEAATFTTSYSKSGIRETAAIKLRARSKERAEKKLQEQEWNLQSTASEWETILNELEAEITQAETLQQSFALYTKASAVEATTKEQQISKAESSYGVAHSLATVPTTKEMKTFSIDQEEKTLRFDSFAQDLAEIERIVDEINREHEVVRTFKEYSQEKSDSGIALVRRTIPRTKESCTHVISVSTSLQQKFETSAAGDILTDAVVELTLPSSSLSAEIIPRIPNREQASLMTNSATEEMISTSANYSKCTDTSSAVMARQPYFIREKSSERLKETEAGAVEILS
ncbi:unnamed protein product, partial [Cylicostephanus goldi]